MPAGRKPMGLEQVELLPGSAAAKLRLEVLLANVAGELSVEQACAKLGLHKSRFFELRKRWLQESVETLEPEPTGRPVGSVGEIADTGENQSDDPETGSASENRPPRIAADASGAGSPTPDTSGIRPVGALGRIAELEDLLAQTRWELRASRLREELATYGLPRPKRVRPAQKKNETAGGRTPWTGRKPAGTRP